jgi:hypothetical protein
MGQKQLRKTSRKQLIKLALQSGKEPVLGLFSGLKG